MELEKEDWVRTYRKLSQVGITLLELQSSGFGPFYHKSFRHPTVVRDIVDQLLVPIQVYWQR